MFAIPDATTGHTHLLHPPVYLLRVLASYNVVFSLALRGFIKMKMQWGKKKSSTVSSESVQKLGGLDYITLPFKQSICHVLNKCSVFVYVLIIVSRIVAGTVGPPLFLH